MAKDSKKPEDLELTPDKAGDVKGGAFPPEPGGGVTRRVAVKKSHKKVHSPGPVLKMPHE